MKTPDEIKKGLETCPEVTCESCPYPYDQNCQEDVMTDALAYIQQLEAELAAVKRERNALLADLCMLAIKRIPCDMCRNDHRQDPVCKSHQGDCSECSLHCPCEGCWDDYGMEYTGENFQWRGVCLENTGNEGSCLTCKHQGVEGRGICMDCDFHYRKYEPIENTEVQDDD